MTFFSLYRHLRIGWKKYRHPRESGDPSYSGIHLKMDPRFRGDDDIFSINRRNMANVLPGSS
jgi:hypothetical protein